MRKRTHYNYKLQMIRFNMTMDLFVQARRTLTTFYLVFFLKF